MRQRFCWLSGNAKKKNPGAWRACNSTFPQIDNLTSSRVPTASIYRHCKELQRRQRTLIKLCQEAIIWRDWGQWLKGQQNSHKSRSISLASRLDLRVKIECRIFTLQIPFHLAPGCEGSKFQALTLQSINQQWHDGGALHEIACHPWRRVLETASLHLLKQFLVFFILHLCDAALQLFILQQKYCSEVVLLILVIS